MATQQTRQQVANQLNQLQKNGASEQQISDAVAKAGYTESDFNLDLNSNFTPLTAGAGKVAGVDYAKPTLAEQAESDQFYKNLASESTSPQNTTTTSFSQSTGGASTTTYTSKPVNTEQSKVYADEAKRASKEAELYRLNPSSNFGARALDKKLATGEITQEQYNEIKNSTPEQRAEKSTAATVKYDAARDNESKSQIPATPTVVVSNNGSSENLVNQQTTNDSTTITGAVPESGVTTVTENGTTYQVTTNAAQDSKTYTDTVSGQSVTLSEPQVESSSTTAAGELGVDGAGVEPQVESSSTTVQTTTEVFDDGSSVETFPDGATVVTDSDGNVSFNAAPEKLSDEEILARPPPKKEVPLPPAPTDWRVRISLAPSANYLYKAQNPGILGPLNGTKGVIFPYMPAISVSYTAQYDSQSPTHSNFKIHNYQSSAVDTITITGDFTAQDVNEANYMLAVIHFFRSATKMFYGQDQNPARGVPPPLLYLSGLGQYQFDNHPMVLTSFNYTLPQDVDYINAYPDGAGAATNTVPLDFYTKPSVPPAPGLISAAQRLFGSKLPAGASKPPVIFLNQPAGNSVVTRVPTKINVSLTFYPIVTRNAISNKFSLKEYATGQLLRGSKNAGTGGGIW